MAKFCSYAGCLAVLLFLIPCANAQERSWYYCRESKLYYPYTATCPGGWQKVVPHKGGSVGTDDQAQRPSNPSDAHDEAASFKQGRADRRDWESWFADLTGDFREGAAYWFAHRSDPGTPKCDSSPLSAGVDWSAGCRAARTKLLVSDLRRHADNEYQLGWSSAPSVPQVVQAPLPLVPEQQRLAVSDPSPSNKQEPVRSQDQPDVAEAATSYATEMKTAVKLDAPTKSTPDGESQSGRGPVVIIFVVIAIGFWIAVRLHLRSRRRKWLMEKYHDAGTVAMIMDGKFWSGMTKEMLVDSLGSPIDLDEQILKTKYRETFKYDRKGRNRYGLRVTIEDGIVVGWKHSNQQ